MVEIINPHDAGTLVSCTGMKMKLGGYVCISVRVQQKDRNANATGESVSVSKASDVEMKASSVGGSIVRLLLVPLFGFRAPDGER